MNFVSKQNHAQGHGLRPPSRWHDPLRLVQEEAPSHISRIVLWVTSLLVLILMAWATLGQLDIIVSAEGKLVPQTLVKIVQPAEAGVVTQLLVREGDKVKAGQLLARLDATLTHADKSGVASDIDIQRLQVRRMEAELAETPMERHEEEDAALYGRVERQYQAHRSAFREAVAQEGYLLEKVEQELRSAVEVQAKLEQTLPSYQLAADNFSDLARDGYVPAMRSVEKQREATEKAKDLQAQRASVASLKAAVLAQQRRIAQLRHTYRSDLEKELADVRARIAQLEPNLEKSAYREQLTELRAPQAGIVKDLATTTVGAVLQPGAVILSLVPQQEALYADINIKNEDVGFIHEGQHAQIKLAAYPFQKYGMLTGKVVHLSADSTDVNHKPAASSATDNDSNGIGVSAYKARIQLDQQILKDADNKELRLAAGMQVQAEINQGRRTVLEYLLSPLRKVANEAGRER